MQRLRLAALLLLTSCGSPSKVADVRFQLLEPFDPVRVKDCDGPPRRLSAEIVAALPPRSVRNFEDDWAALAVQAPGGFAGVFFDNGRPVLLLTRPAEAAAAKAALAGKLHGFPVASAEVRQARWDFRELFDWYNYLMTKPAVHAVGWQSADKDERANRVAFGVTTEEKRTRLAEALAALDIPCDLVVIEFQQPVVAL